MKKQAIISFSVLLFLLLIMAVLISETVFKSKTEAVIATITNQEQFIYPDINQIKDPLKKEEVNHGKDIMVNTAEELNGYTGNHLSCVSCHTNGGLTQSLSFVGVAKKYPSYSERDKKVISLADRINGCMVRSMNGEKLPEYSSDLKDMVSYIEFLSKDIKDPENAEWLQPIEMNSMPDTGNEDGERLYQQNCLRCHGSDGKGSDIAPALWGEDSYNDGAGMSHPNKAAGFILENMPMDSPGSLTKAEAAAIAKYIDKQKRPHFNE
ncbi:c-type cytochrome [Fictibacillus fluitans]|uniref:C-type cytochrome n=1 Tax=Fictibacillus fluitans TaxID=3058422 RepID=A0ABT8HRD5_9BACL|nr:c-type cytochrome [Fictibacillus sp. NE201]MDN4523332.1 c-type cytochrome [Fictibacillus sp. NE201]